MHTSAGHLVVGVHRRTTVRHHQAAMHNGESALVAPPLISLGPPVRFWVLTVMVLSASPESPLTVSSGRRRSSPVLSLSALRAQPVSDAQAGIRHGPRAVWAALAIVGPA
jgi:hypothetical protein